MSGIKVHELAKEFGMSSKELMEHLVKMGIPAKSHATSLVDAYVDLIRVNLADEIAEHQAKLAAKAQEAAEKEAALRAEEEAAQRAVEEARAAEEAEQLRIAEEAERAIREEERRKREEERAALKALNTYRERYIRFMDDDLNTADAIAAVFELIADINNHVRDGASAEYAKGAYSLLLELANVLGLLEKREDDSGESEDAELAVLIEERGKARAEKNWARADEIRDILKARGITLKDTPQGVQIIRE